MKFDLTKILESFNNLNAQARYGIFGAVVELILAADVFLLALPQCRSIGEIDKQIKKTSEDTLQILKDKQRIKQIRKNLEETRLKLEAMNNKVRSVQEVPAVLETISRVAQENGVKIEQLMPDKPKQESLTVSADGRYYALPVMIQARCGYHKFGVFLNKLEHEELYFILKDLTVQHDDKLTNGHSFALTIKIILVDKTKI